MLVKRKTDRQSLSTPANKKNPGRRGARPGGSFTEAIIKCIRWTLVPRER
jgi:hypothetical protein